MTLYVYYYEYIRGRSLAYFPPWCHTFRLRCFGQHRPYGTSWRAIG